MVEKLGTKIQIEVEVFWLCRKCKATQPIDEWEDNCDGVQHEKPPNCSCCTNPMVFTITFNNVEGLINDTHANI